MLPKSQRKNDIAAKGATAAAAETANIDTSTDITTALRATTMERIETTSPGDIDISDHGVIRMSHAIRSEGTRTAGQDRRQTRTRTNGWRRKP